MPMKPMVNINIKNQEFLNILNEYKDVLMHRLEKDGLPRVANLPMNHGHDNLDGKEWVSEEYMNRIMGEGHAHSGFPRYLKGFRGMKPDQIDPHSRAHQTPEAIKISDATVKLNTELGEFLACRNSALNACYPPGGFISWHNNANAHGYNIVITWSETGEGWFDYYDLDQKKRVRIQDKPGWQAKMTYFGPYDEPETLCYHAAYTDCYRITVSFVFAQADNFWRDVIEDLESSD
jgi:hypothetical protein